MRDKLHILDHDNFGPDYGSGSAKVAAVGRTATEILAIFATISVEGTVNAFARVLVKRWEAPGYRCSRRIRQMTLGGTARNAVNYL